MDVGERRMKKSKEASEIIKALGRTGLYWKFIPSSAKPINEFISTIAEINENFSKNIKGYPYSVNLKPRFYTKIIDGKEVTGIRFLIIVGTRHIYEN